MREHLNHDAQKLYDQFVLAALRGGCDQKQAEQIGKERYMMAANAVSESLRIARNINSLPRR